MKFIHTNIRSYLHIHTSKSRTVDGVSSVNSWRFLAAATAIIVETDAKITSAILSK